MRNIKITIGKELRAIVRDKKSLLMMALTPLFIPLFVILMSYVYDFMMREEENIYSIGVNYTLSEIEIDIVNQNFLKTVYYNSIDDMKSAYDNGDILAYVVKEDNNYTVYNNNQSEDGSYAGMYITNYLDSYNTYLGQLYLANNNVDLDLVYSNISYDVVQVEGDSMMASQIINMAIIFTIMAMTLTAIYAATDLTAGEKERGTLETLLTYPIKSSELILGKFFAIVISSVITLIISIILSVVSLLFVKYNFAILDNVTITLNIVTILLMFLILSTYAFFISGLCITIASGSKSFKEAQSSLTPVSLFVCVPMFLELLDVKLGYYLVWVPLLNHSFVLGDIFAGNINMINILIIVISSIIYSLLLIWIIIKQYKSEKILFGDN